MNASFHPDYANPPVPNEVNVSEKTPLADFFRLSIGLALLVVVITGSVFFIARWYAPKIPFAREVALVDRIRPIKEKDVTECQREGEAALQTLADALAKHMDLPPEMRVRVRFSDSGANNAYASLGGRIVILRGLLNHVESENALAMVLAHEIAHIKARDPLVSMSGGVAVALLFSSLIGGSDGGVVLGAAMGMTQMRFSRAQESLADREALAAVQRYYGHTRGADEFFNAIVKETSQDMEPPAFLSTHPASPDRIAAIRATMSPNAPEPKPLPEALLRLRTCRAK